MDRKSIAWLLISIGAALVWISPIGDFIVLLFFVGLQNLFPSTISWDAKNAFVKCPGAIADPRGWPVTPAGACEAMYLCANGAPLTDQQRKALYTQIHRTPGCQEP